MSRALGYVLFFLALTSVVYAARSNICLANTANGQPYKPLQLYPKDCPNNATNCTATVYNYSPPDFMSKGPKSILPVAKNRESLAYMTQDESDNLDLVVITATTYQNNIIRVNVEVDGAPPGGQTLMRDDPTPDSWNWDPTTNSGNFSWQLDAYFTDGVVLGHFKGISCFRVNFLPNYNGAVATISFLSGNVTNPTRVFTSKLTNAQYYEFCQYPLLSITSTDASCKALGSASATSLTTGTATWKWTNAAGTTVSTTSSATGLNAGNYTVTVTVNDCSASRSVSIGMTGVPVSATWVVTNPTKTKAGKIDLTISGGDPPYSITWRNPAGTSVSPNTTSLSVSTAGTYTVTVSDGCSTQTYEIEVGAPGTCPAGTQNDPNGDGCLSCPAGTFSSSPNSDTCTVCPPGTWNTVVNATSCNTCAANTYSGGASGPCNNCPVSTASTAGSGVCDPCPVGTDRASGATSCAPCAAGTFRCSGNSVCQPCPAGTFSAAGSQVCEACDPGTITAQSGLTTCSSCPANKYAASGASVCSSCPSGTTAPVGSSVLLACM